jgi:predicted metal-dependent hydrolase
MSIDTIELGDISIEVTHKDIKNIHLSVHPPVGRVTISAPNRMDLDTIRLFSISKLGWIRKQQTKLRNQKRETAREYLTRESHYFLGKRYLLKVIEQESAPKVILRHDTIEMYVRSGSSVQLKEEVMQSWYRQKLRELLPDYISKMETKMNVKVQKLGIKKMKTRWGTCNSTARRIWLNTELAKKPIECIEYVLIHEMVHFLERKHNNIFHAYMDEYFPAWKETRIELNRSMLGHVEWEY